MRTDLPDTALLPRLQPADDCLRPTRAEVDLGALAHNFRVVRAAAGGARVFAIIKADAYGHGAIPVARRLQDEGASGFGVALAEEALELRRGGVTAEIVILNGVYGDAHAEVLAEGLSPVVYEEGALEAFARAAAGRRCGLHVKVDTGMARLGVPPDRLDAFLDRLEGYPGLFVDGVMTHFSAADSDDEYTDEQLRRFRAALERLRERGHRPRVVHAANSAATFRHPGSRFDAVRPGIALFGYPNAPGVVAELFPVMKFRTEIISLRDVPEGGSVGYDRAFRAPRATRIATVPCGYADGLLRSVSHRGHALVRGRRVPIAGLVSMDLTGLDVTDVPGVSLGDEVVFLGAQEGTLLDATELAAAAGTAVYEVLTSVSRRVPRFYVG